MTAQADDTSPAVKRACTEPALGAAATRALGRPLSPPLAAHVGACLACLLERRAFDSLDEHEVAPSAALRNRILHWFRDRGRD